MNRKVIGCASLALMLPALLWFGGREYKNIIFNRECGGHLKRAADSNTIALATIEMATAVNYLEANHLTNGYTLVFYNTPDEDVGFWHQNLKASLDQLQQETAKKPEATALEQSTLLLKLRQTLLDHKEGGEQITAPTGISVYPNNLLWGVAFWIFLPLGFLSCIVFIVCLKEAE